MIQTTMQMLGRHMLRSDRGQRQQGMAVISVLLVVAVITVLAAALLTRQTAAIRSAQSEQARAQASWLLRGDISRVQVLLQTEAHRDPTTRLDGRWNQPVDGQPIGEIEGASAYLYREVTDEQGKFNMRNLVDKGQIDPDESAGLLRLCALLGIPLDQAKLVAQRVVLSLVEADRRGISGEAQPQQTEEMLHALQQIGLNSLPKIEQGLRLRVIEDLLGVPGVQASTVAMLRPFVTILPQRTWVNSNTAKAEVLAARVPGLSLDSAHALLQARDRGQWFINRGDFANRLQIPSLDESAVPIGITSQWFRVSSALQMRGSTLVMQALVHDSKVAPPQIIWLREGL